MGNPLAASDPQTPLFNLSILQQKIDSLRQSLSQSLGSHSPIAARQIDLASAEIASTVHQIIVNGAALVACSQNQSLGPGIGDPTAQRTSTVAGNLADGKTPDGRDPISFQTSDDYPFTGEIDDWFAGDSADSPDPPDPIVVQSMASGKLKNPAELRIAELGDGKDEIDSSTEIVELDMMELLVEHVHFCEICGKGFKRDANLRMHMRAHGNQFRTPEALVKPERLEVDVGRKIRFSCPFSGCNRNRLHKRFRPLKSAVCVKNHYKRSHCPKMYSCNRCNKKSFSVLADLKSHLKHCGECRWRCSCGTTFSRKDKLFGHVALFEGHMPAIVEEKPHEAGEMVLDDAKHAEAEADCMAASDFELFDNFLDFGSTADAFDDVLGFL
ncbi:hypothetical protein ACLOJK_013349 [Asimina triloba]